MVPKVVIQAQDCKVVVVNFAERYRLRRVVLKVAQLGQVQDCKVVVINIAERYRLHRVVIKVATDWDGSDLHRHPV